MAGHELSVLSCNCLHQSLGDEEILCQEVKTLDHERNETRAVIKRRFTSEVACQGRCCNSSTSVGQSSS